MKLTFSQFFVRFVLTSHIFTLTPKLFQLFIVLYPKLLLCTHLINSQQEMLLYEHVNLDETFSASLLSDIIKGMTFIHKSSIHYHGNLKSSNCLVTARWMVKLSDFGLSHVRSLFKTERGRYYFISILGFQILPFTVIKLYLTCSLLCLLSVNMFVLSRSIMVCSRSDQT